MSTRRMQDLGVVCMVLATFGCGSSDSAPPIAASPDAGVVETSTPPAPTGTLSILVASSGLPDPTTRLPKPFAGATVYLDPPGGGDRIEKTSGPDGVVTFTGLDWSKGTVDVFAWSSERVPIIGLGIGDPSTRVKSEDLYAFDGLVLSLYAKDSNPDFALVKGSISNKLDPSHVVTLAALQGGAPFQTKAGTYSLRVPKSTPLSILTTEYEVAAAPPALQTLFRWTKHDLPAVTADATIPIDLGAGTVLTPVKTKRTLLVPGGITGPFAGATAYSYVIRQNTQASIGYATAATPSADKASFAVDMEHVVLDGVVPVLFDYLQTTDGASTWATTGGYPTEGATISDFLLPPAITTEKVALADGIPLDVPGDVGVSLDFYDAVGSPVATVFKARKPGETSLMYSFPALPESIAAELGAELQAVVTFTKGFDPAAGYSKQYSYSRSFIVTR